MLNRRRRANLSTMTYPIICNKLHLGWQRHTGNHQWHVHNIHVLKVKLNVGLHFLNIKVPREELESHYTKSCYISDSFCKKPLIRHINTSSIRYQNISRMPLRKHGEKYFEGNCSGQQFLAEALQHLWKPVFVYMYRGTNIKHYYILQLWSAKDKVIFVYNRDRDGCKIEVEYAKLVILSVHTLTMKTIDNIDVHWMDHAFDFSGFKLLDKFP